MLLSQVCPIRTSQGKAVHFPLSLSALTEFWLKPAGPSKSKPSGLPMLSIAPTPKPELSTSFFNSETVSWSTRSSRPCHRTSNADPRLPLTLPSQPLRIPKGKGSGLAQRLLGEGEHVRGWLDGRREVHNLPHADHEEGHDIQGFLFEKACVRLLFGAKSR